MDSDTDKVSVIIRNCSLVFLALMAIVLGFKWGLNIGHSEGMEAVRNEAAKAGAAEWVPGANGEPMILWRKGK